MPKCTKKYRKQQFQDEPLRPIRAMVNQVLTKMDWLFAGMYEADVKGGHPSIAPEKLLRAMLLQVLYSIRSEPQLMEQTEYNLLFRWFIGLSMDDVVCSDFPRRRRPRTRTRVRNFHGGLCKTIAFAPSILEIFDNTGAGAAVLSRIQWCSGSVAALFVMLLSRSPVDASAALRLAEAFQIKP